MSNKKYESFLPSGLWRDIQGNIIQAHGGGVLYDNGMYYWFGQNMDAENARHQSGLYERVDVIGVSCYSSDDLMNWKNEGVVLPAVQDDPDHDLHTSKVLERPRVVYNDKTGQYVMWMHIDSHNFKIAKAGVAVSDNPTGPYQYLDSYRPNDSDSRDITVFKDDDGRAYLIYSSEENSTMHIAQLADDYLTVTDKFTRNFIGRWRQAPAVFKHNNLYYCITSASTGWAPNESEYAVAKSIMGPWDILGNPCVGKNAKKTFFTQGTFVLPVQNQQGAFIFMADQWKKEHLKDSRYAWLPIEFDEGRITIDWIDTWDLSFFDIIG